MDTLKLANRITKAMFPELYGQPNLSIQQTAMIMGARGLINEALQAAVAANELDAASNKFETAYNDWDRKTQWVQDTAQPHELGMHRADVMAQRLKQYHGALQRVGIALGLPAGADLTTACVPAIQALRKYDRAGETSGRQHAAIVPRDMSEAPRDGTTLRLLVNFTEHALEDSDHPQWTIGHNNFDHDGEDVWQFAGWCWQHDHYTAGQGLVPIGWLPLVIQGDC